MEVENKFHSVTLNSILRKRNTSSAPTNAIEKKQALIETFYKEIPQTDFFFPDDIELIMGSGGFSTVLEIKVNPFALVLDPRKSYVFKKFSPKVMVQSAREQVMKEVAVSRALGCGCGGIHVSEGGVFASNKNGIVMPKADETLRTVAQHYGDLEVNGVSGVSLTDEDRRQYYTFIAKAVSTVAASLERMHAMDMVHGDVKSANILITNSTDGEPLIALADFGSVHITDCAHLMERIKILSATPFFVPPESLLAPAWSGKKYGNRKMCVSAATDVWALGVTLLELINAGVNLLATGFTSYEAFCDAILSGETQRLTLLTTAPPILVEVAQDCLAYSPKDRITLGKVREKLLSWVENVETTYAPTHYVVNINHAGKVMAPTELHSSMMELNSSKDAEIIALRDRMQTEREHIEKSVVPYGDQRNFIDVDVDDDTLKDEFTAFLNRLEETAVVEASRFAEKLSSLKRVGEYNGHIIYEGPRGGTFYLNDNGNKTYVKLKADTENKTLSERNKAILDCFEKSLAEEYNQNTNEKATAPNASAFFASLSQPRAAAPAANKKENVVFGLGTDELAAYGAFSRPNPFGTAAAAAVDNKGYYHNNKTLFDVSAKPHRDESAALFGSRKSEKSELSPFGDRPTGSRHVSGGSANGATLYQGPKGGIYYINSNGNKSYVKVEDTVARKKHTDPYSRDAYASHSSSSKSKEKSRSDTSSHRHEGAAIFGSRKSEKAELSSFGDRPTGSRHVSGGSANGATLYQGPKGGIYYINSNGNKSYVKK